MDFGVVLQTQPARLAHGRARRARPRRYGFSHVWTFDSHLLWQEPYVIYSQILAETRKVDRRADGHQPGHPRLDGHRVAVRDAQRDVRQPHGLRHRPRRLGGAGAQRQADHAGDAARGDPRDPRAGQRPRRSSTRARRCASRGATRVAARGLGGRVRSAGAEADRRGRRRLHPAAGRPRHRRVDDQGGAARPPSRPAATRTSITFCVAAPAYVGDDLDAHARPVPLVRRDGRQPRRRHRRPLRRRRRACRRRSPTTSRAAQGYDYNEHGRAGNTHADFVPDEIVDRFCILGTAERAHRAARGAARRSASTSSRSTCSTTTRRRRCAAYGETVIPARPRARDGEA